MSDELLSKTETIESIPRRDGHLEFRGITSNNKQFDANRIIRAILGDASAEIESPTHYLLFKLIQNEDASVGLKVQSKKEIFEVPFMKGLINKLQKCHLTHPFTTEEAMSITNDLMDKKFRYFNDNHWVADTYVADGLSDKFRDWPQDIIFASFQPKVSFSYGSKILIFKEKKVRSIDKEYWMMAQYGYLGNVYTNDIQETMSPAYLLADTIQGMVNEEPYQEWTMLKIQTGDQASIGIFDTQHHHIPLLDSFQTAYDYPLDIIDFRSLSPTTPVPALNVLPSPRPLPLIGVITQCEEMECYGVHEYILHYPVKSENAAKIEKIKKTVLELSQNSKFKNLRLLDTRVGAEDPQVTVENPVTLRRITTKSLFLGELE